MRNLPSATRQGAHGLPYGKLAVASGQVEARVQPTGSWTCIRPGGPRGRAPGRTERSPGWTALWPQRFSPHDFVRLLPSERPALWP